ncbi:unnamed protein product [Amoebophrya sp. A120]|nr:unnamed protein product [Amoebophrya sp. A120]|eukprot:GSA120T00004939001.1
MSLFCSKRRTLIIRDVRKMKSVVILCVRRNSSDQSHTQGYPLEEWFDFPFFEAILVSLFIYSDRQVSGDWHSKKPVDLFTVTVGRRASSATHYIPETQHSMLDLMERILKDPNDEKLASKFNKIRSVPNMQQQLRG